MAKRKVLLHPRVYLDIAKRKLYHRQIGKIKCIVEGKKDAGEYREE